MPSVFVVNVCLYAAQFIHCEVLHRASGKSFEITVVYGANDASIRDGWWCALLQISKNVKGAWIVLGDFNNVLNLGERIGS